MLYFNFIFFFYPQFPEIFSIIYLAIDLLCCYYFIVLLGTKSSLLIWIFMSLFNVTQLSTNILPDIHFLPLPICWNMFLKRLVKFKHKKSSINLGRILSVPACLIFLFIFLLCGRWSVQCHQSVIILSVVFRVYPIKFIFITFLLHML